MFEKRGAKTPSGGAVSRLPDFPHSYDEGAIIPTAPRRALPGGRAGWAAWRQLARFFYFSTGRYSLICRREHARIFYSRFPTGSGQIRATTTHAEKFPNR